MILLVNRNNVSGKYGGQLFRTFKVACIFKLCILSWRSIGGLLSVLKKKMELEFEKYWSGLEGS